MSVSGSARQVASLNSVYGGDVLTAQTRLGAPAAAAHAAGQSVVAGVHRGSFVAAMATAVAAVLALASLPARAAVAERAVSRTEGADSRPRPVISSQA